MPFLSKGENPNYKNAVSTHMIMDPQNFDQEYGYKIEGIGGENVGASSRRLYYFWRYLKGYEEMNMISPHDFWKYEGRFKKKVLQLLEG